MSIIILQIYIILLKDKIIKIQVIIIILKNIHNPTGFLLCVSDISEIYPVLRNAVVIGLYSKNVNPAFNPDFNKLNGKKAGISNFATASRG